MSESAKVVPYFGDELQAFANGVQIDLRVKLAIEFLKGPAIADLLGEVAGAFQSINKVAPAAAALALDLASELLEQGERRGLVKPISESDEINAPTRKHIRRQVRANVYGQVVGQEIAEDETKGKLQRVPPGAAVRNGAQ